MLGIRTWDNKSLVLLQDRYLDCGSFSELEGVEMLIRAMSRGLRPGVLFPSENLKIDISVLVRTLAAVKLSEPSGYCSIKKLEVNQKISQMKLDRKDFLDKSVMYILKKDIHVLEAPLMLDKRMTLNTLKYNSVRTWKRAKIPDSIKYLKWNPDDDKLIRQNLDNLVNELRSQKNRDAFIENIFSPSDNEYYKEKTNIVGSFLGQGLSDPRLPCEIFYRASKLINSQRITFSEEDDKTIIDYLKHNKKDTAPFASLSKVLGYSRVTIHTRYKRILQQGGKRKTGAYSADENREIMTAVFQDKTICLSTLIHCGKDSAKNSTGGHLEYTNTGKLCLKGLFFCMNIKRKMSTSGTS